MPKYMSFEQCSEEAQAVIEAYFRAEYAGLLSFARKLNLNENLAEEAVQETFVIFLRNYERWKTRKLESGWMYGVLKNIAMHILRDENETKLQCISLEDVVYEPGMEEPGYHFAQHPPDDPDLRLLKRFYVDGMHLKDLAAEYGVSVVACKMRLKRARERVRKRNREEVELF